MKKITALYQNRTGAAIKFGIGRVPGAPWDRYDSEPGQIIEGPGVPNYQQVFVQAGYTVVTAEEAKAYQEAIAAKAKAKATKKTEPEKAKTEPEKAEPKAEPKAEDPGAVANPQKGDPRGADGGPKG